MNISIFGFGRVGAALGVVLASKGHKIVGVDVNEELMNNVNKGQAPFPERDLDLFLRDYGKNIKATLDPIEAIKGTEISFILVPTPSTEIGSFDNKYIYEVFEKTLPILEEKKEPHFFIVSSTVSPGSMKEFKDFLEKKGLEEGKNFYLCYNPAFIRQGSVIKDFLFPDVVLIGGPDEIRNNQIEEFWKNIVENDTKFVKTNFINAEIAKITLNTFVTLKISFANLIGNICEQHLGADSEVVMSVIKNSEQIVGKKLLSAGLGYGGPCLPRDNNALRAFAGFPEDIDLSKVIDAINDSVAKRVINSIEGIYEEGDRIGILGLTYKPGTYITTESQALQIANILSEKFGEVRTYDPMAEERTCNTKEEVIENSEIILILTPWPEFSEIPVESFRGKKIYDAWRFLEAKLAGRKDYYVIGKSWIKPS